MLSARRCCRKTSFPEPGIKSILQNLLVVGCYAPSHRKRIGNGRVVGNHRTAATTGTTQAQRRQASRAGSSGPDRHHLRAQERHTLGDASQGDGLREREYLLGAPARVGGGWGVARAAPGLARSAGKGRRDRLGASLARFGERGGRKGGEKVGKNPTDRGKPGSKRHVVSDRRGVPLAVALTAANIHDSKSASARRSKQRLERVSEGAQGIDGFHNEAFCYRESLLATPGAPHRLTWLKHTLRR